MDEGVIHTVLLQRTQGMLGISTVGRKCEPDEQTVGNQKAVRSLGSGY